MLPSALTFLNSNQQLSNSFSPNNENDKEEKKKSRKFKFSTEEDISLKELVDKHGTSNWAVVASAFPGRTPRQCRDRWNHYLSQDPFQLPWTDEEDKALMKHYEEVGSKWTVIARYFPSRNAVVIRNRCCRLLRRFGQGDMNKNNNIRFEKEQIPVLLKNPKNSVEKTRFPSCASLPFPFLGTNTLSGQMGSLLPFGLREILNN